MYSISTMPPSLPGRNAAGDEIPKSFIVCADEKAGQRVYLSQLNTSTLLRRSAGRGLDASFE